MCFSKICIVGRKIWINEFVSKFNLWCTIQLTHCLYASEVDGFSWTLSLSHYDLAVCIQASISQKVVGVKAFVSVGRSKRNALWPRHLWSILHLRLFVKSTAGLPPNNNLHNHYFRWNICLIFSDVKNIGCSMQHT